MQPTMTKPDGGGMTLGYLAKDGNRDSSKRKLPYGMLTNECKTFAKPVVIVIMYCPSG